MSKFQSFNVSLASEVTARHGREVYCVMGMRPTKQSGVFAAEYKILDIEDNVLFKATAGTYDEAINLVLAQVRETYGAATVNPEHVQECERKVLALEVELAAAKKALAAAKGSEDGLANLKAPGLDTTHGGRPATEIPAEVSEAVRETYRNGASVAECLKVHGPSCAALTSAIVSRLCADIQRTVKRAKNAAKVETPVASETPAE
jgi:hypothetical protein